ncbi:hypothetical protein HK104_003540 [Borealophlyctis nickersoniae]|nr:hypothetical protein HK104_003540 [Borealophlyctis nickersoniae]
MPDHITIFVIRKDERVRRLLDTAMRDREIQALVQVAILEIVKRGIKEGVFCREEDGFNLEFERSPWSLRNKYTFRKDGKVLPIEHKCTFTLLPSDADYGQYRSSKR